LIARYLSSFECFKRTSSVNGDIAEVGVYRGAVSLFFAKLLLFYESRSTAQVHGFDLWPERSKGEKTTTPISRRINGLTS